MDNTALQRSLKTWEVNKMLEVPPSSHWVWDRELDNLRKLFQRGEEERLTSMVYKGAQMMVNQPKLLKVGEFTLKAPLGLVPRLGRYQAGWEDETFGVADMSLLLTHDVCFVGGVSEEWVNGQIARWKLALNCFEEIIESNEEPGLDEELFH
jgi:hypothetical protein